MSTIRQQIIGSFEDLGREIAHETAKLPKDIAGNAMESLGVSTSTNTQTTIHTQPLHSEDDHSPLAQIDKTSDVATKKAIARSALEQLAGHPQETTPSIWEKQQEEHAQKKELKESQQQKARQILAPSNRKSNKRGMYGIKQKASTEISKNARQD